MRAEKTLLPTFLTLESKDLKIKDVLSEWQLLQISIAFAKGCFSVAGKEGGKQMKINGRR